jgi:hypothetical protein
VGFLIVIEKMGLSIDIILGCQLGYMSQPLLVGDQDAPKSYSLRGTTRPAKKYGPCFVSAEMLTSSEVGIGHDKLDLAIYVSSTASHLSDVWAARDALIGFLTVAFSSLWLALLSSISKELL